MCPRRKRANTEVKGLAGAADAVELGDDRHGFPLERQVHLDADPVECLCRVRV